MPLPKDCVCGSHPAVREYAYTRDDGRRVELPFCIDCWKFLFRQRGREQAEDATAYTGNPFHPARKNP